MLFVFQFENWQSSCQSLKIIIDILDLKLTKLMPKPELCLSKIKGKPKHIDKHTHTLTQTHTNTQTPYTHTQTHSCIDVFISLLYYFQILFLLEQDVRLYMWCTSFADLLTLDAESSKILVILILWDFLMVCRILGQKV